MMSVGVVTGIGISVSAEIRHSAIRCGLDFLPVLKGWAPTATNNKAEPKERCCEGAVKRLTNMNDKLNNPTSSSGGSSDDVGLFRLSFMMVNHMRLPSSSKRMSLPSMNSLIASSLVVR